MFNRIISQKLMTLTARALQQPPERIWTLTGPEALQAYAVFTATHLSGGVSDQLWQRMNSEAYRMGATLRRRLLIRRQSTAQRLVRLLYRQIGIDMQFEADGTLRFNSCYFSRHYTPAVCRAASALDDGIIRGILGLPKGRLHFSRRLTEGCPHCSARIKSSR